MTELRKIAAAMGGEVVGNVASFPTPGHSPKDRGSWASLVPGAPDGVLINSANGGDPLAIKDELRAKGVLSERSRPERARDVAAWEYQDADGVTVYRKVRMTLPDGGKSYRFEHPDGRGGWKPKRGDAPQVPYRLPDLIAADPAATVFMAEGEKQAEKLARWGLVATSLRDWRREFGAHVAGRTVVILPDNDQAGADYAEKARKLIEAAGGRPALVALPGLGAGGDIMDWSGDAAELAALVDAALRAPVAAGPALLDLEDTADWNGLTVPRRRWLLDGWLPVGEAAFLTGAGSVGKSLIAQQLAATLATGKPFMGVSVEQVTSIYITCEDSPEELRRRQASIADMLGGYAERGRCLATSWKGQLDLELFAYDEERRLRPTPRFEALRATALAIGARFVVLDNTSHLFGGDENVKREVAAFVNLLNGLAADIDGVVLLLGHPNKTGLNDAGASTGNQFGGSVAWENQVRSRMFMAADPNDPDVRELTNPKANYTGKGDGRLAFRWYKGAFINPDDLPENTRADLASAAAAGHDNGVFLACLDAREEQGLRVSGKPSPSFAPTIFADMPQSKGIGKGRLKAAMNRLLTLGVVRQDEVYDRSKGRPAGVLLRVDEASPHCSPHSSRTLSPDCPEQSSPTTPLTHSPTYGREGGALNGPPPFIFPANPPRVDGMILAPGETGDEPIPGWEDLS